MLTKEIAIDQVKQFLIECKKLPVKIDRVILFGSLIKGKADENSDIDVALFSSDFTDNILQNLDLIGPVNIHFPNIDAHTFSSKSFRQKGILLDEIRRTGMEIK
jgi:predicted nucleotidyltransferase